MDAITTGAAHRVPVIDKMMHVLLALEATSDGLSVVSLARDLGLSRTTVYRMLNTLEEYGVVARTQGGTAFALGPALVRLARRATVATDAVSVCQPLIEQLARDSGQTVKVSILEHHEAVVVAVAPGSGPFSIAAKIGRTFPLHAGAASKLLLAHAGAAEISRALSRTLSRHTATTIVHPGELTAELDRIREQGWAEDRGEFVEGVRAIAVPVRDPAARVVAAISITFIAGLEAADALFLKTLLQIGGRATLALGGSLH